jgi:hypothetical protein
MHACDTARLFPPLLLPSISWSPLSRCPPPPPRQLYPQLQALSPCTGLWAAAQQGIHGDIWHFCWAPDCLQAAKMQPRPSWGWSVNSQVCVLTPLYSVGLCSRHSHFTAGPGHSR